MILDTTSKSLIVDLDASKTTTDMPFVVSYVDITSTTNVAGSYDLMTNGTTVTTLLAAPAASTQRQVLSISISNADSAAKGVAVGLLNGATTRPLVGATLQVNDTLQYTDTRGWSVIDGNGNTKTSAITFSSTTPSMDGAAAIGIGQTAARADHVHPSDTSREAIANKDASGGYVGLTLQKLNFWNAAKTFLSFFTNANTVARTYTFPDKDLNHVAGTVDITGGTLAGSFTTIQTSGNMGIGGTPLSSQGLHLAPTLTGALTVYGASFSPIFDSTVTTGGTCFYTTFSTVAAAFTIGTGRGVNVDDAYIIGAGSSITNLVGIDINDQTKGTNNYGIRMAVSSGANKWNFYISGTANNAFGGNTRFGSTTAPVYTVDVTGTIGATGAIKKLGGIITSGVVGAPAITATGRSVAATAAVASVSTFTVGAADASFEVSANVLVTTATTHSFNVTVDYTDEGNTARALTLNFSTLAGVISNAAITNVGGAVPYEGMAMHIRCKAVTAITIATTGTFTAVVYNVEGIIKQTA